MVKDSTMFINIFRTDNSNSSESTSSNPMVDLFYGQYRADGVNEGNTLLVCFKLDFYSLFIEIF